MAVLLALIGAGAFVSLQRESEPLFQGRPARFWLRQLSSQNPQIQAQAFQAFNRAGSAHLPFVIAAIKSHESIYDRIVRFMGRTLGPKLPASIGKRLPQPNFDQSGGRVMAIMALRQMGSGAADAVPALIKALEDPSSELRSTAIWALSELGPAARTATPALLHALNDKDASVRTAVLVPLQNLGATDPTVVPALEKSLHGLPPDVRLGAADLLWRLSHKKDVVAPVLIEILEELEPDRFWFAAGLLAEMLPEAKAAVPALVRALSRTNENNRVRGKAAITLGEMGPLARAAIPALVEAANDHYSNVREAAVEALKKIVPDGATLPRL